VRGSGQKARPDPRFASASARATRTGSWCAGPGKRAGRDTLRAYAVAPAAHANPPSPGAQPTAHLLDGTQTGFASPMHGVQARHIVDHAARDRRGQRRTGIGGGSWACEASPCTDPQQRLKQTCGDGLRCRRRCDTTRRRAAGARRRPRSPAPAPRAPTPKEMGGATG
jgi:hypothetical protein